MSALENVASLDDGDFAGKRVLLRVDINAPIDRETGRIANDNRIQKSLPTIRDLLAAGARLAIIAHQGDTTDYASLVSLEQHAARLAELLGQPVDFIEDVAGPAAVERIRQLGEGQALLLDNIRYLTEEVSTFEDSVRQEPADMASCYLVRRLAPEFDCYVNDAFAAAHRNSPSMVGFQELLPSFAGRLLMQELDALQAITEDPARPCVYMLGGSRAGDAFGMIERVLEEGSADTLLLSGLVGEIFMMADGIDVGETTRAFILDKGYGHFIEQAREYLANHRDHIVYPKDVAIEKDGKRLSVEPDEIRDDMMILDIGDQTIDDYLPIIAEAKTILVNGPAGVYENELFENGTRTLWNAVADAPGFTVVGGGDSVTSFAKFVDIAKINYVSTAGGALIRYLSGVELPLIKAMTKTG